MSFADKWLQYVQKERKLFVHSVILRATDPNGDFPMADVKMRADYVEMIYGGVFHSDSIPDKIKVDPIDAETVEIDAGLYTFKISKNGDMKISYITAQDDLSHEDEKKLIEDAKNLGYNPTAISMTDV